MKHTPGPWKHKHVKKTYYNQQTGAPCIDETDWIDSDNESIALIVNGRNRDTSITDAKLIAAAPDLLAACEIVQANLADVVYKDHSVYLKAAFDAVTEAIRVAKGENNV